MPSCTVFKNSVRLDAQDKELRRLHRDIAALDVKISRLSDLPAETSSPERLLKKIEQLESGRRDLASRYEELERVFARASAMEKIREEDVLDLLGGLEERMKELSRERLKDILRGRIDMVTLDPCDFLWPLPLPKFSR